MTESQYQGAKIVVTGGAGFIGSRLVQALLEQGAEVTAFLRYTSRADSGLLRFIPPELAGHLEIVHGDLRDWDAIEQVTEGCDLVFHLGALISIPYSYIHPVETVETNILGTLNVLQACRKHAFRLIHTSSSEVYGTAQYVPIDEAHPLQGQSPYSASKIGADKLVESYTRSFGLETVTVRPFNTYGPGQSMRAVIPTIISQALTQQTIHLGNLETRRDFTYVDDTVSGFLLASTAADTNGETYNLGTGIEISVGDLVQKILTLIGKPLPIVTEAKRLRPDRSEVLRLLSDNRKAWQKFGWQPRVPIEQGLRLTIDWIKQHPDFYHPEVYGT